MLSSGLILSGISNENVKELDDALGEIIQAYLRYAIIGWTRIFHFNRTLEKYEPISQEIFKYLIDNPTLQYYKVMVGKFYIHGFGINKDEIAAFEWYMRSSQQNDINCHFEVGFCYYSGLGIT